MRQAIKRRIRVIQRIFRFRGFRESLKLATKGAVYLLLYHRNMRIIFLLGITALLSGILLQLHGIELVALSVTITLVFMAEIFNTAIELLMDMIHESYHIKIKVIKDIAAAVVLLTALNSLAVGYILFARKIFRLY